MKRVDLKSAKGASPVEISMQIIDALIDAVKSQEAEIIITFKKDLDGIGDPFFGDGVRIEFGGCNTFIVTGELGRVYFEDLLSLTGVFRFLSQALAQREEEGKNESESYLSKKRDDDWKWAKEAGERRKLAIARDKKYLADEMDIKDSADAK